MSRITKIEAMKKQPKKKIRVAAYARVSTGSDKQLASLDTQKRHYEQYIKARPDWDYAGLYFDEGVTGTKMAKCEGLLQMLGDCERGLIDMILTKSISRFSRNTVDCLKYTRELKTLNIAVFFEKENINTLDAKGEVLMTIMAALAQQESESLSANVRLGIQFRNQEGKVRVNHNWFLGYTKDEEGKLIIDPDQAEVVRRIYAEYLDGKSLLQIKRGLEADGVSNGAGHKKWYESNIKQILTNEKYIGDALLQKTCTVSVLEKKRVKNDGALPKYYVEGCHEAIISRDIFLQVQSEMRRRANLSAVGKKRVYSGKYALSSIVYCAYCGDIYRRIKWNNRGYRSIVWRCVSRVEQGGPDCTARTVREDGLHRAVLTAVNDVLNRKDSFLPILKENIRAVLGENITGKVEEIDKEIKYRQAELLRPGNNDKQIEKIGDAITYLRESRQEILTEAALKKDTRDRIENMMRFLDNQICEVTEYSETLTRRLIEKVTVYDEKMVIEFRSGLQIKVDA